MALTPIAGFDGSSTEEVFRRLMAHSGTLWNFGPSESSMRPTAAGAGDRAVTVAEGVCYDRGNIVENVGSIVKNHDPVASGTRWDLGVVRRNYSSNAVSLEIIKGSSTKAIPVFQTAYPVCDQPVYLARLQAGSTAAQVVDLRVHQYAGGMMAWDQLALDYHRVLGARVTIDGVTWSYEIRGGSAQWIPSRPAASPVSLLDRANPLAGGSPPMTGLVMQAGTTTGKTDSSGYRRITFPTPFPGGLLTVVITNGDDAAANDTLISVAGAPWGTGSKESVVYRVWGPPGGVPYSRTILQNFQHRANWIAIGW